MPIYKQDPPRRNMSLAELIDYVTELQRNLDFFLNNLDWDNINRFAPTQVFWSQPVAITAATPAGKEGETRYGTSTVGTGIHLWKSGNWHYLNTTIVP